MDLKKLAASFALGLGIVCLAAPIAHAQEDVVVVEAMHPALYMNGGIGKDEEAYMRKVGKDFSLRMEFAEHTDNEFAAGVKLAISDLRGNTFFYLPSAGPMTDVMLPNGKYRVSASFNGKTETQTVTIASKQGTDLFFHWKSTPRQ